MTPKPYRKCKSDPADWGLNVTVCLAGLSRKGIVLVSDSMVSTSWFSADKSAFKMIGIHDDWKVQYAGNDLGRILPFGRKATQYLEDAIGVEPCSFVAVENAIRRAWKEELKQKIEDSLLNRYQMTVEDFVNRGEAKFGSQYPSIKYQIDEIGLGFELLVSGYDAIGKPYIFSVSDPGLIDHHTQYYFWAIGSGATSAISHFFSYRARTFEADHEVVAYRCVAAKFAAESSPGVGKDTTIITLGKDGSISSMSENVAKLRELWEINGVPQFPQECFEATREIIGKAITKTRHEEIQNNPENPDS